MGRQLNLFSSFLRRKHIILIFTVLLLLSLKPWQNIQLSYQTEKIKTLFESLPNRKVESFNCAAVFNQSFEMSNHVKVFQKMEVNAVTNLLNLTANCLVFRRERGYIMDNITKEEASFPIAYGIFFYNHVDQFERLLRAIYRPHNVYCIHLDKSSSKDQLVVAESIARCLPNVFLASSRIDIAWGKFSMVEADLVVMRDLLQYQSWRYYINLCGRDFPLKTNLQIVRMLKMLNGDSAAEFDNRNWSFRWKNKKPPPHNIKVQKGSHYVALCRDFVNFTVNNKKAIDFKEWVKDIFIPDETFYVTLLGNPHIGTPHPYNTSCSQCNRMVKYVLWINEKTKPLCSGEIRNSICIFGLADIQRITSTYYMFANKFNNDLTYACMEEWHFNQTREEYLRLYNSKLI